MRRREFITLVGGVTLWTFPSLAQQSGKVWRLGYIGSGGLGEQLLDAFTQKLGAFGYVQGKSIAISRIMVPPEAKAIETAIETLLPEIDILVIWGTIGAAAAK